MVTSDTDSRKLVMVNMLPRPKSRPRKRLPPPAGPGCARKLEFVPQGELHYARIGHQVGVVAKPLTNADGIVAFADPGAAEVVEVKARGVGHVEYFPAEGQTLLFTPWHGPTFGEPQVHAEVAVATDGVPYAHLPR